MPVRQEEEKILGAPAAEENFFGTVRLWGSFATSRALDTDGCLFVCTGVAIPDQNYVLGRPAEDAARAVRRAVDFFAERRSPFTWWNRPSAKDNALERQLADTGLLLRCSPRAMVLGLQGNPARRKPPPEEVEILRVRSPEEAKRWAATSLEGFGSDPGHGAGFSAFATEHIRQPFTRPFRLMTLTVEGIPAATGLLSVIGQTAGLYYLSTRPAFRNRGLGALLLDELLLEAVRSGCIVATLQASPMGHPLYVKRGFRECFRFSVHSSDPEAC